MVTLYTGISCPDSSYIHTPLIEICPLSDDTALRHAAGRLPGYDYLLFTSRFAVHAFAPHLVCVPPLWQQRPAPLPHCSGNGPRLVAIGSTTAAAVLAAGLPQPECPDEDNSHSVVAWFACQPRGAVLLPRSNLALNIIPDGLRRLGFTVDTVVAYENRMPRHPRRVDLTTIDRIIFTSPSTVDNFVRLYGHLPAEKLLVARGPVTAQHLKRYHPTLHPPSKKPVAP